MAWTTPKTDFNPGDILLSSEMNAIGANLDAVSPYAQIDIRTRTTGYDANNSSIASMGDIFSSDITFTADGTSTYWVQFHCGRVVLPNSSGVWSGVYLTDGGSTIRGLMAIMFNNSATGFQLPCSVRVPFTPAAGSTTINARATCTSGTASWSAGSGGTGTLDSFPIWMGLYGPDST